MAAIAKNGKPSYASLLVPANDKITGLHVGEDIAAGDACVIKSDGLIWRATGAADDANARVDGFASRDALVAQDDPLTLIDNSVWGYGSGLTPGKKLYLSGTTPGGLVDAASTGGKAPIGVVIDSARVKLWSSRY